ncbi:class I SAM-dependent methyltransferase [Actinomycetospora sp. C-140]
MSRADRERWDARFAGLGRGEPGPPDALIGREDLVPTAGRALDLACGRGQVAVWLARRGLDVDAVDVSPVALEAGRAEAPDVHWIAADLDDGLPVAVTRLRRGSSAALRAAGPYDIVVCQRFRDPALYPALVDALAPGGLLVISVLSEVGDTGGPFRAAPGELLAAFGHLDVIDHDEGLGRASLVARTPDGRRGPSR